MTTSGIYSIRNLFSDRVYIGSAANLKRRYRVHRRSLEKGNHENIHLQRSWDKHGPGAFEFKTILYCKPVDLIHYEQLKIDEYCEELGWGMLYNINPTAGSALGVKCTPKTRTKIATTLKGHFVSLETRAKISAAKKGKKLSPEHIAKLRGKELSPEHREKLRVASTGRKHSPEILAKMSAAQKGRKVTSEARAKISATLKGRKPSPEALAKMRGRKLSPEHRAKISVASKGRKHTIEARAKISAAHMGMKPSLETRAKMSAARMGKIPWNKGRKHAPALIN